HREMDEHRLNEPDLLLLRQRVDRRRRPLAQLVKILLQILLDERVLLGPRITGMNLVAVEQLLRALALVPSALVLEVGDVERAHAREHTPQGAAGIARRVEPRERAPAVSARRQAADVGRARAGPVVVARAADAGAPSTRGLAGLAAAIEL